MSIGGLIAKMFTVDESTTPDPTFTEVVPGAGKVGFPQGYYPSDYEITAARELLVYLFCVKAN